MNKTFTSIGGKSTMNLDRRRADSQTRFQTASPDNVGLKSERYLNDFTTLDQYLGNMKTTDALKFKHDHPIKNSES